MDAGTSDRGTTGSTQGKSGNVATRMMSRSFLSAKPVWPVCPTTAHDTRLRQASVDGAKPRPLEFARGNKFRMSRCRDIMRNRPLISPRT